MTPRVEEIMEALRGCRTIGAVNAVAKAVGGEVYDMMQDPVLYTMAHQIRNLAEYRRMCIRNGWTPPGHAVPVALGAGDQAQTSKESLR